MDKITNMALGDVLISLALNFFICQMGMIEELPHYYCDWRSSQEWSKIKVEK